LLNNHLYVGEVAHNGNVYKGEHEAIIDREQWLAVQQLIAENRQGPKRRHRVTKNSLLTGILFDAEGNRLTPTHANKAGKRYRYYTSQTVIKKKRSHISLTRIPAPDLERVVLGRMGSFLSSDDDLYSAAKSLDLLGRTLEAFFQAARKRAEWWENLPLKGREELARLVLVKVVVFEQRIEISLRLSDLLDGTWERNYIDQLGFDPDSGQRAPVITMACPFSQVRRGQELRLIIGSASRSSRIALPPS